jgi:class 3 adenylate cyclase
MLPRYLLAGAQLSGQFNIQVVGPLEVKGRTRPVDTYEVFSEPAPAAA